MYLTLVSSIEDEDNFMKILMLSWEYPPRIIGGISRVVYDLSQNLGKCGNDVHVLTCWEPGTKDFEIDNYVNVHRVHVYNIPSGNFVEWVMQLNFAMLEYAVKLIQNNEFDIIHAHDWLVAYASKVLKHSYNIPLIATIHATEYGRNCGIHTEMQITINNIETWLVNESDRIVVNSSYMRDELVSIFNVNSNKISVISNGVDLDKFKNVSYDSEFRKRYALPNEKIVFFVGRLVNEKGVHVLLNAIPKILKSYSNVKFVIAGKGPCLNNLIEISRMLNIQNKVYITGFVSEEVLLKLYKCSDIAVFPSTYEPFGIVALEGMVAGIPVVVSDTGGLKEIVAHKEDGMEFYSGNSNSLADCIIELLRDNNLSDRIRNAALKKVHKLYNWSNISQKILNEYEYVISQYIKAKE
jgi:glycosyltransferase involved in cell wall biosynthesis